MNDLERLCRIMGTFDLATGHAETMSDALDALEEELKDVLGHLRGRREWVGLTDEEKTFIADIAKITEPNDKPIKFGQPTRKCLQVLFDLAEAKLKEKNT